MTTDIVERLYGLADDITPELAAEEITRLRAEIAVLRADLLKAEMQTEFAGLEDVMRAVARGRREGIEAAAKIALRIEVPEDAGPIDGHARVMASVQIAAAIRKLLEANHD